MPYSIEVRSLAVLEIIEAYDWYELQQEGLGLQFLHEVDSFYESLLPIRLLILTMMNR